MGLRAKEIVLGPDAQRAYERLRERHDHDSVSIVRKVRYLKPILLADCQYGEVVKKGRIPLRANSVFRRRLRRTRVLYFHRDVGAEGAAMCDEYYDARMKAFWRALAEADEREIDEKDEEPIVQPLVLEIVEPPKAKPKTLLR